MGVLLHAAAYERLWSYHFLCQGEIRPKCWVAAIVLHTPWSVEVLKVLLFHHKMLFDPRILTERCSDLLVNFPPGFFPQYKWLPWLWRWWGGRAQLKWKDLLLPPRLHVPCTALSTVVPYCLWICWLILFGATQKSWPGPSTTTLFVAKCFACQIWY